MGFKTFLFHQRVVEMGNSFNDVILQCGQQSPCVVLYTCWQARWNTFLQSSQAVPLHWPLGSTDGASPNEP